MQATFNSFEHTGKIAQHRKEKHFCEEYAVLVPASDAGCGQADKTMKAIITARLYAAPSRAYGATYHVCIWINSPTHGDHTSRYLSGGGKASGCGYHKASAALQAAINDAQVTLSESIGGVGETAMLDALEAIAAALGYQQYHNHHAHA